MAKKPKAFVYWENSKGEKTDVNALRIDSQTVWSMLQGENPNPQMFTTLTNAIAGALGKVADDIAEDWRDELNEWAGPVVNQKQADGSGRLEVWQNPSKEGEFPHRRTGSLQRSIKVSLNQAKLGELGLSVDDGGQGFVVAAARVYSDPQTPKEEEILNERGKSLSPKEYSSLGGKVDYMRPLVEKMSRLGPDALIDSGINEKLKAEVEAAVRSVFSRLD